MSAVASMKNPADIERILRVMQRYRDPQGVYLEGGCIDPTREYFRWVHSATSDLRLPEQNTG